MAQSSSGSFTVQIMAPPAPLTASFQLTSTVGGTGLPYMIGFAFRKGDIPAATAFSVDKGTAQVLVKRQWNDGTVKHVVVSGHVDLVAGVAQPIQIGTTGTASAFPTLTSADIQNAAPTASVQCGSAGTVQLQNLLATPFRTWISGPEMVECHYRAVVGADTTLRVWFHVRLYRSGQMWVRAICENGYLDVTTGNKVYQPNTAIMTIGGATVFTNSGATAKTHFANTRWDAEGWIGGDPQITPKHNVAQLISTRLVPNYWKRNPSAGALSGLSQVYTQMGQAGTQSGWTINQGDTGFQNEIGILPLWDALYCTSGDPRAYRSVIANSRALNSYAIVWRDSVDNLPTRPSARSTWSIEGNNQGGSNGADAGSLSWDMAHHGSGGYLAYLITGDYYHLETMQHQSSLCYLCNDHNDGIGTNRILTGQSRAMAWSLRTVGQLAAIGPSDTVTNDYIALLAGNMTFWRGRLPDVVPAQNALGILYSNELATNVYDVGFTAVWQQNFAVQTLGYLSEMDPLADMTALNAVRDYYYRWPVGLLGTNGSSNFCYTNAGEYTVKVASAITGDTTTFFDTWGQVFQATYGVANGTCGANLLGSSGGDPGAASGGYWGNLLPAISYAVDHGATDAATAFGRMTGAANFSLVERSGFDDLPIWGIVPKGFGGT